MCKINPSPITTAGNYYDLEYRSFRFNLSAMYMLVRGRNRMNQKVNDFENICIKCGKMYSEHPTTGRFNMVILFGHECAWNPDHEFKGFVKSTLRTSGYDLVEFGYES